MQCHGSAQRPLHEAWRHSLPMLRPLHPLATLACQVPAQHHVTATSPPPPPATPTSPAPPTPPAPPAPTTARPVGHAGKHKAMPARLKAPPPAQHPAEWFARPPRRWGTPERLNEFPESAGDVSEHWQATKRILAYAGVQAAEPKPLAATAAAIFAVYAIGMWEATMLVKGRAPPRFVFRYALDNVLPSVIWLTKPAEHVAVAMGYPRTLIRNHNPLLAQDARAELHITSLQTARSIIAGFMGIAQILRFVGIGDEAADLYEHNIAAGKEPPLTGTQERVIRFAGTDSDVTWLSIDRYGPHILAIVEDPEQYNVCQTVKEHSENMRRPVIWHVPGGAYSKNEAWEGFNMDEDWLITTKAGKRVLVIEADSSVGEQALALSEESNNDLSLQEASQGFRRLAKVAVRQDALHPARGDRVMRVLLANAQQRVPTGGGNFVTLEELVREHGEADVLIDARRPLVKAIVEWAEAAHRLADAEAMAEAGIPQSRTMVFDTRNHQYFRTISALLSEFGWRVLDRGSAAARNASHVLPRLVYHDTTADTQNTIESLLRERLVDDELVCALLDSKKGLEEMQFLKQDLGITVAHVCSAEVYDDLFAMVRADAREGASFADIQRHVEEVSKLDAESLRQRAAATQRGGARRFTFFTPSNVMRPGVANSGDKGLQQRQQPHPNNPW